MAKEKQRLKCPNCKHRVMDKENKTKAKVFNMEFAEELHIDLYLKCSKCKTELGIKIM